jgi:hypothetical protein
MLTSTSAATYSVRISALRSTHVAGLSRKMSSPSRAFAYPLKSALGGGKRKPFEPQSKLQVGGSADPHLPTHEARAQRHIEQLDAAERGHVAELRNNGDEVTPPKRG